MSSPWWRQWAPSCPHVLGLDDVLGRRDQLIRLEGQEAAHRLRLLLAGDDVGFVHAEDLHEVDAVYGVHDAVQLALVEGAAEFPAAADPLERSPDERIEV